MQRIHCSNCGKLIPENSNFCRYCGAAQHGPEAAVYRFNDDPTPNADTATVAPSEEISAHNPKQETNTTPMTIKKRTLSPRVIWLFFFSYIGNTAILLPLFAAAIFFEPVFVGTIFAGYILLTFLLAVLAFQNFLYLVDEHDFRIEYGIFHKRNATVPFRQIQNVNINRTIVDRFLGIARVSIESAGSSSIVEQEIIGGTKSKSEAYLPGVKLEDAKILHDLLLQRAHEIQSSTTIQSHR